MLIFLTPSTILRCPSSERKGFDPLFSATRADAERFAQFTDALCSASSYFTDAGPILLKHAPVVFFRAILGAGYALRAFVFEQPAAYDTGTERINPAAFVPGGIDPVFILMVKRQRRDAVIFRRVDRLAFWAKSLVWPLYSVILTATLAFVDAAERADVAGFLPAFVVAPACALALNPALLAIIRTRAALERAAACAADALLDHLPKASSRAARMAVG
jgi:hypothetical protein